MSAQNNASSVNPPSKSASAIVSLVLGVIALATSFLPIINNVSFFFALAGIVFGVVGLVGVLRGKKSGKGLAVAAIVVNVLAAAVVLGTQSMYSAAIDQATKGAVQTSDGTAASAASDDQASSDDAASIEPAGKYSIADEAIDGNDYSVTISGVYTNNSGSKLGYVQLSYTLYDADGNQIDTAFANTNNLEDGGSWKFEAMGMTSIEKVASYKLAEVSAW